MPLAHIIENGKAVNTVEVDSLINDRLLHLEWATASSSIGDSWDGTDYRKPPEPMPTSFAPYADALTAMYNAKAAERRYDNYITCAMRAAYPGPYQAEGRAFGAWMDACNSYGYGVLAQFNAGAIPQPNITEFVAMLNANVPALVWPPATI